MQSVSNNKEMENMTQDMKMVNMLFPLISFQNNIGFTFKNSFFVYLICVPSKKKLTRLESRK